AINLSRLNSTHRCGVFELGISHKGDMDELVDLVRPTVAVLTCVTNAHNEWLGSLQEIVHEKSKVFRHVPSDGARIINGDQPELKNLKTKNTITFGFSKGCDVTATEIKKCVDENNEPVTTGVFRVHGNYVPLKLRGHHDGVLLNSLAAAATANYLGCSNNDIVAGLWDFKTVQGRGAVKKIADGLGFVIDDCYNAHALSVCAALRSLDSIPGKRKIAVLGDLYEQGYRTYEAHHEVAQCLGSTKSISHVIILGDAMTEAARKFSCGTKIFSVASWQEALQRTKALLVSDSRVLLKASGRLGLTNIVNALIEK
ncbi:UDP-N-acetylmuramoyl-tripeptide--D-alanyl-D-alanine ligase, partial [bacterium]|nr:UDP-N-acetylmuramoyl-tripeptide--D-alanyl-D-alanine ligase [bacterium]